MNGGTPPYQFMWSTGASTEDIDGLSEGTYEVDISDANGCTVGTKMVIISPQPIKVTVSKQNISCSDQSDGKITITNITGGFPPYSTSWSTGSTDLEITDLEEGEYTLTVVDSAGCTFQEMFPINKKDSDCLFIPNTFSPNGDNINDTWNIRNAEIYPSISIRVFNRWGQDVLLKYGYETPWDGNFNGKGLEPGTYYYIIDLNDGSQLRTGSLTIIK